MEWTDEHQRQYEAIVHNLRSQGWSKADAMMEADEKMSYRIERERAYLHTADEAFE